MYEVKCRAIQAAHADKLHSNHLMSSSPSKLQKKQRACISRAIQAAYADRLHSNHLMSYTIKTCDYVHHCTHNPCSTPLRCFAATRPNVTKTHTWTPLRCFAATRPNVTNATSRPEDSNVTHDSNTSRLMTPRAKRVTRAKK